MKTVSGFFIGFGVFDWIFYFTEIGKRAQIDLGCISAKINLA